jgi:hypothetical protein
MWHGMFLLLIGMVTGVVEPYFTNVRMGLAAHLEGLVNGILLLALGAAGPSSGSHHERKQSRTGPRSTAHM